MVKLEQRDGSNEVFEVINEAKWKMREDKSAKQMNFLTFVKLNVCFMYTRYTACAIKHTNLI